MKRWRLVAMLTLGAVLLASCSSGDSQNVNTAGPPSGAVTPSDEQAVGPKSADPADSLEDRCRSIAPGDELLAAELADTHSLTGTLGAYWQAGEAKAGALPAERSDDVAALRGMSVAIARGLGPDEVLTLCLLGGEYHPPVPPELADVSFSFGLYAVRADGEQFPVLIAAERPLLPSEDPATGRIAARAELAFEDEVKVAEDAAKKPEFGG